MVTVYFSLKSRIEKTTLGEIAEAYRDFYAGKYGEIISTKKSA